MHRAGPGTSGDTVDLGNAQLIVALQPFDSCDDELAYLKEQALAVVGPYGISGFGPISIAGNGVAEDATASGGPVPPNAGAPTTVASADSAASTGAGAGGGDFSGTNVQEIGIDEPDIVKTDGQRIVAVAGNTLYVVDISGATPVLVGSLTLSDDAYGGRLLLDGDRALLLTQSYGNAIPVEGGDVAIGGDVVGGAEFAPTVQQSKLVDIDLDATRPAPRSRPPCMVDGYVLDARQIGDVARIVVRSAPEQLPFVYPSSDSQAALDKATEVNQQVIEESTIDDWLPHFTLDRGGEVTDGRLLECGAVSHPETFSGFATLSVLTVDLTAELGPGDAVGVLADGETVYASADNLYVTTNRWVDPAAIDRRRRARPQ